MSIEVGSIVEGKVLSITKFGAFIQLPDGETGLVHISEIADQYVTDITVYIKRDEKVRVKVIAIDSNGKPSLSIKRVAEAKTNGSKPPPQNLDWAAKDDKLTFEERMSKFKKDSEEKLSDLKRNFESKRGGGAYKRSSHF